MQKHEVINKVMHRYAKKTPINRRGLEVLYNRAESRGYKATEILIGLETVICKNYYRKKYVPPYNDPACEAIDERRYIEDWEFRAIMMGYIRF